MQNSTYKFIGFGGIDISLDASKLLATGHSIKHDGQMEAPLTTIVGGELGTRVNFGPLHTQNVQPHYCRSHYHRFCTVARACASSLNSWM